MSSQKYVCQSCGDNFSDENFMLGMCCGKEMIWVDKTLSDLREDKLLEDAKASLLEEAKKLTW